ncbi:Putative deoxyribonuclease RhsC [Vibrio aerogenes CECT 7868]|uniref:Putative deoxyribonuclease RhsC n=1 Tax=Vibrio aerogenes CECT 7868 TaxID=1216006 RepID=A0A1M5ZJL9_9VIBR|nr:RHS repeat-associated core domain-containing protein [Vibrio aerogenes]SHI24362.1 Putative deoxyribonuclease RhsC [Vibrio aerogenes CECT 7868]
MAKKKLGKAVDWVKKIEEIIKIAQKDTKKYMPELKKAVTKGEGSFNKARKKKQKFGKKNKTKLTKEATSISRNGKSKTRLKITNNKKTKKLKRKGNTRNKKKTNKEKNICINGCPVSMVSGEELLTIEDVILPGAVPFTFKRTYRTSACEVKSYLGYGWSHTLSHQLEFTGDEVLWYDNENRVTSLLLPDEAISESTNPIAGATLYLSDKAGEFVLSAPELPFLHFKRQGNTGHLVRLSDNYNNELFIQYNQNQQPQAVVNPHGIALWLNYNEADLISSIELKTFSDTPDGREWQTQRLMHQYDYNESSQLISEQNEAGEGEYYHYNEQHVITGRQMAGGMTFGWEWEGESKDVRCTKHWSNTGFQASYLWDDEAHTVTVSYPDGSTEVYQHDEETNLINTTDPDGAVTTQEYNDDGQLVRSVDALGYETLHYYDDEGQRELTVLPDGTEISFEYLLGHLFKVTCGDATWRYFYNLEGDLTEKRDPLHQTTFYHYNPQGNLSRIAYPDGSEHQLSWNRLGMLIEERYPDGTTSQYRHDISGRVIYQKSSIGGVTQYQWDEADRLVKLIQPNGKSKTFCYNAYGKVTEVMDEAGRKTAYEYEENSHLLSRVTNPDGTSLSYLYDNPKRFVSQITNERGEAYNIDYFTNGLVKTETTFDGRQMHYAYDLLGQLLKKTEVGSEGTELVTEFTHDEMGRLSEKVLPDGNKVAYGYDESGNLASIDDGETPLAWKYDLLNRVTEEHQNWASNYFEYDVVGQVVKWQLPDAKVLHYQRGQGGLLNQISLDDHVLTRHLYQNGIESRRTQGAVISSFDYDTQGRLVHQSQSINGHQTRTRDYGYDALGNLSQIADSRFGDSYFDYDPLSRLKAVRGNLEEHFVHDATGNVLSQHLGRRQDELNLAEAGGNQLTFHGDSHYEYDEFGRLMTEKRGKNQSLITTYEYDCQHRLIQASMPDGTTATYTYDAFGRRTKKVVTDKAQTTTTTEFIWQGDNLIGEVTGSDYKTYVYEPGTFRPLAQISGEGRNNGEVYYYHLDQIGTPIELTDVQGQSVWSVQYRAYGNVLTQHTEEIQSALRFQGQYYDSETGLHYNRHRYYSPGTGRFTTIDPIGLAGGLNNYQYVPNPTGWVDPLGLYVIKGSQCQDSAARRAKIIDAIEEKMQPVIDYIHKLDPDAQVGFRGSVASGMKGEHKRFGGPDGDRVPFDGEYTHKNKVAVPHNGPQGYDVDLFIVSDKLYSKFPKIPFFKDLSNIDDNIDDILESVRQSLNNNPALKGLKQEKMDIRVWRGKDIIKKLNKGDTQVYLESKIKPQK